MNNDKIVLKDGTEIKLESSRGIDTVNVIAESKGEAAQLWGKFTKDNLSVLHIKDEDGNISGNYSDMVLDHIVGHEKTAGKVLITFSLRPKTIEEVLIEKIERLEAGQQTQDAAIGDLGQVVSDVIVMGGEQ